MDVSIIIVNYNTYQLVLDCIKSIYLHTKNIDFEIIVVDNNSPNREIEKLNQVFPDVKLLLSKNNNGFGSANNFGAKQAKGKYLFLLNSDTLLLDNSLIDFYNFMEKTPDAGVCGGNLLDINLKPSISFEIRKPCVIYTLSKFTYNKLFKIVYNNNIFYDLESTKPYPIKGYTSGADFFTRKTIFDKVNGFDEDFFMYYEETELTYRINQLGYKTYFIPYIKIIHLAEGSLNSMNKIKEGWIKDSMKLYYKKTKTTGYLFDKLFISIKYFKDRMKW